MSSDHASDLVLNGFCYLQVALVSGLRKRVLRLLSLGRGTEVVRARRQHAQSLILSVELQRRLHMNSGGMIQIA